MLILFIIVWGMGVGWVAHLLVDRGRPANWGELLFAGLAGSFVGGLVLSLVTGNGLDLKPAGIIGSVGGAILVLVVLKAARGGNRSAGKRR